MIKYDKTKWVDGTTVLRASHMEKIEKGITDIIDYNNSIYTDEDTRKSNEKQRQEEHSRKMNEVSEVVSDIQKDYDSLQKIIIDENASANLQNQINQTNSQLEHKVNNDDVDFIDVTKFGLKSEDNFDNTELFNALINKGYRNFYFPPGVFELNIVIEKTSVRIKGSGIGKTILKPHIDSDVITLTSERSSIQNFYLSDLSIENKTDFILANGINIKGAGINDWHKMERIKIMNMLNGIYISGRTIWSTFRDIQIMYSRNNGLRYTGGGAFNLNSFYTLQTYYCANEGIYIDSTNGDKNINATCRNISFYDCNIENCSRNDKFVSSSIYGIYLKNIDNVSFINCYIENNVYERSEGYSIFVDGIYCRGLNVSNCLIWGTPNGIKISDTITITSGSIFGNRIKADNQDIEVSTASKGQATLVIGSNEIDRPVLKKFDANSNCLINTISPFSYGIQHNHTTTPSVLNCNVVTSWVENEITNFRLGTVGQIVIYRHYGSGTKTFRNGDYIQLRSSEPLVLKPNETVTFLLFTNNKWVEIQRNVN